MTTLTQYRARRLDQSLPGLLALHPALMIVGPRGVGKTTTAARHAASVVRLDDARQARAFEADADAALEGLSEPVLLDEWQAVPGVLAAVKRAVDTEPRRGRFLLTGSVTAEVDPATWPGVGRVIRVPMHPLTVAERQGRRTEPFLERVAAGEPLPAAPEAPGLRDLIRIAVAGGFPEPLFGAGSAGGPQWYRSYADHIAIRGAPGVERRFDAGRLRNFLDACALGSMRGVSFQTLHEAAGVNGRTGADYWRHLERLGMVWEIPAWASNRLKRLVRRPKRSVADCGFWAALLDADPESVVEDGDLLGPALEIFVAAQLRAETGAPEGKYALHHLREAQGRREVDLVAVGPRGRIIGIEVKATAAPVFRDGRHLAWLRDQLGERFLAGVVLHTGQASYPLGERVRAAPISTLWA